MLEWVKVIVIVVVFVLFICYFIFVLYVVDGELMEFIFYNYERVFVNMIVKYIGEFKRGDIIVLNGDDVYYVKWMIGLFGDIVEMKNDQFYINGKKVVEFYLKVYKKKVKNEGFDNLIDDFGLIKVFDDKYFVMGDNWWNLMDS